MNQRSGTPATVDGQGRAAADRRRRLVAAALIGIVIVLFIVLNRDRTNVSFIVFSHQTSLWVALTVAAAGGFLAGYLVSRRRYRG
jgi:uncharacterized integral membrane protein